MRNYPRYLLSKAAPGSKSQGVFLVHTLEPREIFKVVREGRSFKAMLCTVGIEPAEDVAKQEKFANDWLRANAPFVASFFE